MTSWEYGVAIVIVLAILLLWYRKQGIKMCKASNHVKEHQIIKQQIKITDDKVIDLEIRVKVLEKT